MLVKKHVLVGKLFTKQILSLVNGRIASNFLIPSKLQILTSLFDFQRIWKLLTLLPHLVPKLGIGRCPKLRPETRTQRWINLSGRLMYLQQQLLKVGRQLIRMHMGMIMACIWLSPKFVKELTLFLHGLALFAVVRDQVLSSWLVISRPATRSCRLWEFLNSYPSEDLMFSGCQD